MSDRIFTDRDLDEAIRELPRAVAPRRDLWPSIARRLAARAEAGDRRDANRGWWRQGLAASVAVAFLAGLMFGRQMGGGDPEASGATPVDPAIQAALLASEREYRAAFREFIPVGAPSGMLAEETVRHIENSWADLQQAEAALLAAIREYPDNIYLNQKLLDLRAQQLGFMQQLVALEWSGRRET